MEYGTAPDDVIMQGIRQGDSSAVTALYDRYSRTIFGLGLRMLGSTGSAEEVVQETFLRAWRQSASYQLQLGRVSTWLLSIARNVAVDELRRRSVRPIQAEGEPDDYFAQLATPETDDPAAQIVLQSQKHVVRNALAALPLAQQQVMELAYYGGLTQGEIAARLGDPLGTVKTRMRLATQKLRDLLREESFEQVDI